MLTIIVNIIIHNINVDLIAYTTAIANFGSTVIHII